MRQILTAVFPLAALALLGLAAAGRLVRWPTAPLLISIAFTLTALGAILLSGRRPPIVRVISLALGTALAIAVTPVQNRLLRAGSAQRHQAAALSLLNHPAPDLSYQHALHLPDDELGVPQRFAGRPLVVDFWAAWNVRSVDQMVALEALRQRVGDRVAVIGVTHLYSREPAAELEGIAAYAGRVGVGYPILIGADDRNELAYAVSSLPTTVLIDGAGQVVEYATGKGAAARIANRAAAYAGAN